MILRALDRGPLSGLAVFMIDLIAVKPISVQGLRIVYRTVPDTDNDTDKLMRCEPTIITQSTGRRNIDEATL